MMKQRSHGHLTGYWAYYATKDLETDPDIKEAVWSALQSLATAPTEQRNANWVYLLCFQSNKLRQAMQPYTLDGAYGHLLDGNTESLKAGDMQCFEMATAHALQGANAARTYISVSID